MSRTRRGWRATARSHAVALLLCGSLASGLGALLLSAADSNAAVASTSTTFRCTSLSPVEGAIATYEQQWNNDSVQGGAQFGNGRITDIAALLQKKTGCPAAQTSYGAAQANGYDGSACSVVAPVTQSVLAYEQSWNNEASNLGSGLQFGGTTGDSAGRLPDIAGQIAAASGCSDGVRTADSTPLTTTPPSTTTTAPPQCQIFNPLEDGVEAAEDGWNSNAGSQGAPTFMSRPGATSTDPLPDISGQIESQDQCGPDGDSDDASFASTTTTTTQPSGTTTTVVTPTTRVSLPKTASLGGSGGGGSSSASASGANAFNADASVATAASTGSSGSGTGSALAFTGEPSWISTAARSAFALALFLGLSAAVLWTTRRRRNLA